MCRGTVRLTPGGNLLARRRDANNDALAPALVARLERRAHDARVAGAVKRVVAAAVRHLDQLLDDGLVAELRGVDKVRGAELLRPLLLGRVDVDDDDHARLVHDGALDHRQAHAPGAEDGDVGALLDAALARRHTRRAVARSDAAPQQARPVHGRLGLHGHDGDVGEDRVLREGRSAHEVQKVLALALEARGAVGHEALALRRADLAAEVGLARLAELALLAFGGAGGSSVSYPRAEGGWPDPDRQSTRTAGS